VIAQPDEQRIAIDQGSFPELGGAMAQPAAMPMPATPVPAQDFSMEVVQQ